LFPDRKFLTTVPIDDEKRVAAIREQLRKLYGKQPKTKPVVQQFVSRDNRELDLVIYRPPSLPLSMKSTYLLLSYGTMVADFVLGIILIRVLQKILLQNAMRW